MKDEMGKYLDKIRGCMLGGAIGDALGYEVEFLDEYSIFSQYGEKGIKEYALDPFNGKAIISDDTQMSLFTANGILVGETRSAICGIKEKPNVYIAQSYQDWLNTQNMYFEKSRKDLKDSISWLMDIPALYDRRAPGITCMSALTQRKSTGTVQDYIKNPLNDSKGCGGVMRVAPLGLKSNLCVSIQELDLEGAQIAAITHGSSLGYMPAAVLVHIINRIVYPQKEQTLKEIVLEARDTMVQIFKGDQHLKELVDIINLAIDLAYNNKNDLDNIHQLGEGWVGEEALAIAIYCALKYQNDFSKAIITAVNHRGDSDSTGAITGNILGALIGYEKIDEKWKNNLELSDVILEIADDLCYGCSMSENNDNVDINWIRKYINMKGKDEK